MIETQDSAQYLKTARNLSERVAAYADRIDQERRMPSELANELADAGFFRLLLPRSLGGAELEHPVFLRIIEVFAAVDASVAWCLNQNNVFSLSAARMQPSIAQQIWAEPRAVVTNGPPTSAVRAAPVEGGYRLTGHWNFSSGSDHATWLAALAPVMSPAQPPNASRDPEGPRTFLIPKAEVRFVDMWQVSGLRGTGSFSFQVDDLFVPEERTYDPNAVVTTGGPLYIVPRTLLFGSGFATVALGVAAKSLETAVATVCGGGPSRGRAAPRGQQSTHRTIGEAEAILHSAQAFLRESVGSVWDSASQCGALDPGQRIRMRLASTHALRMSAQVVDMSYNLCGSGAIFASNPIQRRFQDMHVMTQHIQAHHSHYETAGQAMLGLEPLGNY